MTAKLYELSDALEKLARDLDEFTHGGLILDGETAHRLANQVAGYRKQALDLENEVSRHRWNEPALRERIPNGQAVLDALSRPGSNVALFPIIPRPFSDGHSTGGTA